MIEREMSYKIKKSDSGKKGRVSIMMTLKEFVENFNEAAKLKVFNNEDDQVLYEGDAGTLLKLLNANVRLRSCVNDGDKLQVKII